MESGVEILDVITRPCKVYRVSNDTFKIILTQGLNRQIRRMCLTLGYKVVFLQRIRILNVFLEGIEEGKWKYISKDEII